MLVAVLPRRRAVIFGGDVMSRETGEECLSSYSTPLVSVVIPCFNAERTIERAIRSVLDQDYRHLEVIVADDCSTDSSREVVGGIRDERLIYAASSMNQGASAARNRGIKLATGKYIAFLDADDEWLPSKIAAQVRLLEADVNARLATCDCLFLTGSGQPRATFFERRSPAHGPEAWQTLLAYNYIQTSTVIARRDDLLELRGFSEILPTGEDQDLWIRLAVRGSVRVEPRVLVRVHDEAVSLAKRYQKDEARILLSIVRMHLGALQSRLPQHELRAIWSQRLYDNGANLYQSMEYTKSAALFWNAARLGTRRYRSSANVVRALSCEVMRRGRIRLRDLREGATMAALPARTRVNSLH
jgi:glycosyltransferase involved in cell wall biosynthesis